MVTLRPEKLCRAPKAEISGVIRSLISACTTALNATPTTTATARSTRFPRRRNFLNPPIHPTLGCVGGTAGPPGPPARLDQVSPYRPLNRGRWQCGQPVGPVRQPPLPHRGPGTAVAPPEEYLSNTTSILLENVGKTRYDVRIKAV